MRERWPLSIVGEGLRPARHPPGRLRLATRPTFDRVVTGREDDGDRGGRRLGGASRNSAPGSRNHRHTPGNQIGNKRRQAVDLTLRVAIFDRDVAAFDVADLAQAAPERLHQLHRVVRRSRLDESNHRHRRLLRARRERPRGRAADERHQGASM
jgi:hypothetical protein